MSHEITMLREMLSQMEEHNSREFQLSLIKGMKAEYATRYFDSGNGAEKDALFACWNLLNNREAAL